MYKKHLFAIQIVEVSGEKCLPNSIFSSKIWRKNIYFDSLPYTTYYRIAIHPPSKCLHPNDKFFCFFRFKWDFRRLLPSFQLLDIIRTFQNVYTLMTSSFVFSNSSRISEAYPSFSIVGYHSYPSKCSRSLNKSFAFSDSSRILEAYSPIFNEG